MVFIRQAADAAIFKIVVWQSQRLSQFLGAVEEMVCLSRIVTMAASGVKM
jgi:hypothetical protein